MRRRFAGMLIALYPPKWRLRYGDELLCLFEDTGCSWPGLLDIAKGALKMRFADRQFGWLVLGFCATGLLISGIYARTHPPLYVSEARLELSTGSSEHVMKLARTAFSRSKLKEIADDPGLNLSARERYRKPDEEIVDELRRRIAIRTFPESKLTISFADEDAGRAQLALSRFVQALHDANVQAGPSLVMQVVQAPDRPAGRSGIAGIWLLAVGLTCGLMLAALSRWVFWRRLTSSR